jgi:hypothetical protein
LSQIKLEAHDWTVGVAGVGVEMLGTPQVFAFNWQLFDAVCHSNGALHEIHCPLN